MSDISQKILEGAPIDVATFMARAVENYYSTRDPFGADGDFTTAPEISQMFGEMIGIWMVDLWSKLANESAVNIIELGAGRGTLMADAMRAVKGVEGFSDAVNIHLVEISPVLRAKQVEVLAGYGVTHHVDLSMCPKDVPSIIIANEFLDALPVHQLVMDGGKWCERVVTAEPQFDLGDDASDELLALIPEHLRDATDGKIVEVSPARIKMMADISAHIAASGGAALIIDYGYERLNYGDTFQAIFGHKFCGVLENIGEADITTHVDFGALRSASGDAYLAGVTSQGKFLISLGVYQRMQVLKQKASVQQQEDLEVALDRLCSPNKMGTLFKVMAITSDKSITPVGF